MALAAVSAGLSLAAVVDARPAGSTTSAVEIGDGITLHYVEAGAGVLVVFVHGSLSENSYWDGQLQAFSERYRAIAYSRRYDPPNTNPARAGYSAVTDADDLAAFGVKLRLDDDFR